VLSDREHHREILLSIERDVLMNSVGALIITNRLKAAGKAIHVALLAWLAAISNGNPGRAVMWAWTCRSLDLNQTHTDILCWTAAFPLGIPTDEEFERLWDAQKDGGANLLDNPELWAAGESQKTE
jgi:hypothetical protein